MRWTQRSRRDLGRPTGLALIATLLSVTAVTMAGEPTERVRQVEAAAGVGAPPDASWDAFAGDLTIRHQRIAASGQPAGMSPPAMVLRFDRRRVGGAWRTTLEVISTEPAWVQSPAGPAALENPFALARLEFEDDDGPPRMYDRRGQLIRGPGPADIRALGVPADLRTRDWDPEDLIAGSPGRPVLAGSRGPAAGLVSLVSERASRRRELERRHGKPVGHVRGIDRFLSQAADSVHELLVDPETALPVEINVAEHGALVRHATLEYEPVAGAALLRRRIRNEEVAGDADGVRLVTDIELSNVRFTERGAE